MAARSNAAGENRAGKIWSRLCQRLAHPGRDRDRDVISETWDGYR